MKLVGHIFSFIYFLFSAKKSNRSIYSSLAASGHDILSYMTLRISFMYGDVNNLKTTKKNTAATCSIPAKQTTRKIISILNFNRDGIVLAAAAQPS